MLLSVDIENKKDVEAAISLFKTLGFLEGDNDSNGHQFDITKEKIEILDLSCRENNILKSENIYTVGDLLSKSHVDILKFPGCGRKASKGIIRALADRGLTLRNYSHCLGVIT